ncbi:MAG: NAD-dependent deacylase [Anaerolineales bacterium]|nr:NAD-dependent deacylase [Anaerolineales bacterium]
MVELSDATLMGIHCAADMIRSSKRGVVLTGAGISTPSGISDFRSAGTGLWEKYDPFEVASLTAFRYDPKKFYQFMRSLALNIYQAQPNAAHSGVAYLEQVGYIHTIITQNIDGLHQRAGSRNVLEVHGTMETMTCVNCYRKFGSQSYVKAYMERGELPTCTHCQGVLKPDLVLFGEQLPAKIWLKAQEASKTCDLMIVAGSSLEVLPVAGLPMRALENGAHLILINHSTTYLDVRADVVFHGDVDVIIPRIVAELSGG